MAQEQKELWKRGMELKAVTKLLINKYHIDKLGYDFLGYALQKGDIYTFHHLIIPARRGGKEVEWNGAVLCGKTSHPYLHVVERYDNEMFYLITSEIIDMKNKGFLDFYNLNNINEMLGDFEEKFDGFVTRKGHRIIKPEYKRRILRK